MRKRSVLGLEKRLRREQAQKKEKLLEEGVPGVHSTPGNGVYT